MPLLQTTQASYPPGPPPVGKNPLTQLRFGLYVTKNPLGVMMDWFQTYGDMVHLQFGDTNHVYLLSNPTHIHEVLVEKADQFHKAAKYKDEQRGLARLLGNGLITSDGDYWRQQRRLMQPAFHARRIEGYGVVMVNYTRQMLDSWRDGSSLDVADEMMHLTLAIVARTILDTELAGDAEQIAEAVSVFQNLAFGVDIFPLWLPTPAHIRQSRVEKTMSQIISRLIAERRASAGDRGDLLSMMLLTIDEEGNGMTDRQIRDEMVTLFLAGHETTANALNWAWYLLAQHPDIEAKLHSELDAVLQGNPPTFADLKRLPYTEMVMKEAMRLYPPVWSMSRQVIEAVEIGGYPIAKGSEVNIITYATHHDSRWWSEPECFLPERFSPQQEQQFPKLAYLPFSSGPRVCIGNSFAMVEAQLILATIAQRYRLALTDGYNTQPEALITLRPQHGLPMKVQRRELLLKP
ncbi:MAG: cytochrome P450 [Chloroflexota bacterium]|nr:cytochrome P450 [Chloroflexota bacterium]NOG65428.1 cytochrome P450 [Chloroflexota bacterium]GIK64341.1 MAG: cytochrome P450 [Chloroflexota bacterium]